MKKILSLFLVLGLCFGLTGCGGNDNSKKETPKKEEKVDKPLDLTGTWASNEEGTYQEAVISDGTIEINWVSEDDTRSLYWAGTYDAPTKATNEYSWTSKNDTEKTSGAMLASSDDTKEFTYKDGVISYEASAMGSTKTVKLEKK